MVVLNLLFVFTQLLFEFMDSTIYCRQDRIGLLRGDKIVLMFCGDANIDAWRSLVLQIDRDFYCQKPLEESGQLFGLWLESSLECRHQGCRAARQRSTCTKPTPCTNFNNVNTLARFAKLAK